MKKYLGKLEEIMRSFYTITFTKVPREENSTADVLAQIASTTEEEITTSD